MKLREKRFVAMILALVLVSVWTSFTSIPIYGSPAIIIVPLHFPTIQKAINNANSGDEILVLSGIYPENPIVNKSSLWIHGYGGPKIDGGGSGDIVTIVSSNVTFANFTIQNTDDASAAVRIKNSSYGSKVNNNTIQDCGFGIWVDGSMGNNSIIKNNISVWKLGLYLFLSWNNEIRDNNLSSYNEGYGIFIESSGNNTLTNNIMTGNKYNFGLECVSLQEFNQNINESNTVDGKPIYYWIDKHNDTVPADAGFVAIISSTNITVSNSTLKKNCFGVIFANTNNSKIQNVTSRDNDRYGIYLWNSNKNNVSGNRISYNIRDDCIGLERSSNNTICDNNLGPNDHNGISLKACSNNEIRNNTIHENKHGIYLYDSINNNISSNNAYDNADVDTDSNIFLENSTNNTLASNNFTDTYAIGIKLLSSENNTIRSNLIQRNMFRGIVLDSSSFNEIYLNTIGPGQFRGINLSRSSNNKIYHNSFDNEPSQGVTDTESTNTWDNGYPLPDPLPAGGGNYWSDYTGVDENSNGIGDTPYIINANNTDRYPLMNSIHSIAITNITISSPVFTASNITINVTVENLGICDETFDVIIYWNTTVIQRNTTTLAGRSSITILGWWNTTCLFRGYYNISAYVTPVLGETDKKDNTYVYGIVEVKYQGDIALNDGIVDIFDIVIVAAHFCHSPPDEHLPGTPEYDQCFIADINKDGHVDIFDIVILASDFGKP